MVFEGKNAPAVSGGTGHDASAAIVHVRADDFDGNLGDNGLKDDILNGAAAIAEFTGWPIRQTFYRLEMGHIPAGKLGNQWIGSRRAITKHLQGIASGRPGGLADGTGDPARAG